MTRMRAWLVVVLVLLTASAVGARSTDRQGALALFRQGHTLYSLRDFAGALGLFQQAHQLYPSYKIDVNIGYCLEELGRLPEAADRYARFVSLRQSRGDSRQVLEVRRKLRRLQRRLGRILVRGPLEGALVRLDGEPAARTPVAHPLHLWPGLHQLLVQKDGRVLLQQAVSLEPGDQREVVVPGLSTDAIPLYREPAQHLPPPAPPARPLHRRWWLWAGVGGAVVTAVVVGILISTAGRDDRLPTGDLGTIDMSLRRP